MDRDRLLDLGFALDAHLGGVSQGAWSAKTADDGRVVPKWCPDTAWSVAMGNFCTAWPCCWIDGPRPMGCPTGRGTFVHHILTEGGGDLASHTPLRNWGARSAKILDRVLAVADHTNHALFPNTGLVHLDLHKDNILIADGRVSGIIDWDGACAARL
ncbi:phosphotransferase [Actibacterium sp. 188UL27-1]|uniref:phosphotransferase n=1 Tax=Actibacterium sp. 188UL27-1 TaxID=2786961 RepID=UPI00195CCEB7|nr:phosphotransferase [Actibacterium sp. 188UL27-1]MBM7066604.1 phosphotransferase [Actibacterium sp. 188UL27-1]